MDTMAYIRLVAIDSEISNDAKFTNVSYRRHNPEIDVANDSMLGGRHRGVQPAEGTSASRPSMSQRPSSYYQQPDQTNAFGAAGDRDQLPQMQGRPSFDGRRDALGRTLPHSLRGSEVDSKYKETYQTLLMLIIRHSPVSSGLRRHQSRGFDFDVEERSIAVSRLNSRLSQLSGARAKDQANLTESPSKRRLRSPSINLGLSSLRSRAGSVLRPKSKGFFEQTPAMEGERGAGEAKQ